MPATGSSDTIGRAAPCALAIALILYLSFNAGGYFPPACAVATVVVLLGLAAHTVLAERPFAGVGRMVGIPLAALTGYLLWQLVSTRWGNATARGLDAFDQTMLYAATLLLFSAGRGSRADLSRLVLCVSGALAAVSLTALVSRLLPDLLPTSSGVFTSRLGYPLTYGNSEGMLAAAALILGLHVSADGRPPRWVRVVASALLPAVAATLLLTFSRGALGVAIIGLLVYAPLGRPRDLAPALVAAVPTVAVALKATFDATTLASTYATLPAGVRQGHRLAVVVGLCMVAAAVIRLAPLRLGPLRRLGRGLGSRRPSLRLALVAALALALSLGVSGSLLHEYKRFTTADSPNGRLTRDRLSQAANDGRLPLWRVALQTFSAHPLEGSGAGTYSQDYARRRTDHGYVTDAGSLYLQSLAELGIVGVVLIVGATASLLALLAARVGGPERALQAAIFAATLAWALHQAFDWDWQLPASTIWVFVLAGGALARSTPGHRAGRRAGAVSRCAIAAGFVIAAVAPALAGVSYARLETAGQSLKRGDCAAARADALSSISIWPRRPQAFQLLGVCDLAAGFADSGLAAMQRAATLEPASWENAYWLADAQAAAGRDPRAAAVRAAQLNPREPLALELRARLGTTGGPMSWEQTAPALRNAALGSGRFAVGGL